MFVVVYGVVFGGLSSYCWLLYGELIFFGFEVVFYVFYVIIDKGLSVFGLVIVGVIIDVSGEIRLVFWFLVVLVGFLVLLIWFIKVERGKREGKKLVEVIEGFKVGLSEIDISEGEGEG